jgi:hypothetical protein
MRSIVASVVYYRQVILEVAGKGYARPAALRRSARRFLSPLARALYDCFDTHLSFFFSAAVTTTGSGNWRQFVRDERICKGLYDKAIELAGSHHMFPF